MAEAEFDSKRINAERIYEELERRRNEKNKKSAPKTKQQDKKKRQSGKEKKSLKALSEVIVKDNQESQADVPEAVEQPKPPQDSEKANDDGGIFGKMKDLYEKADNMAASQALLLNKKLEDAGVVDKITDETGLKVIGKEEAARRQQEKNENKQE